MDFCMVASKTAVRSVIIRVKRPILSMTGTFVPDLDVIEVFCPFWIHVIFLSDRLCNSKQQYAPQNTEGVC
jgi:hypothetical protein